MMYEGYTWWYIGWPLFIGIVVLIFKLVSDAKKKKEKDNKSD